MDLQYPAEQQAQLKQEPLRVSMALPASVDPLGHPVKGALAVVGSPGQINHGLLRHPHGNKEDKASKNCFRHAT